MLAISTFVSQTVHSGIKHSGNEIICSLAFVTAHTQESMNKANHTHLRLDNLEL